MNAPVFKFVASAPRGLADLLAQELTSFGATDLREQSTGVYFEGTLETAYRACLESRIANRILLLLAEREVASADELYAFARETDWSAHIGEDVTLACGFSGKHPAITHTHFGALRLKDAIVDTLREQTGVRPDIEREYPGVRVHAHARGQTVTLALDLSGESLHRRGYRTEAGEAPLKENVAAGMLIRAGWPQLAAAGAELLDPMCGSGTLVIEAALIASGRAPGLTRDYFGFLGWRGHDAAAWERVRAQADARASEHVVTAGPMRGSDRNTRAIGAARANAQRAGVGGLVRFEAGALSDAAPAGPPGGRGLLATNPPYGVRLEDREAARAVHKELGRVLRERFTGWDVAVLTGAPELGLEIGIRAHRTHTLWNGALECRLLRLKVDPSSFRDRTERGRVHIDPALRDTPGSKMFANRLAKNRKRLARWAASEGISCFRLYDADMPEYAFAIDEYRTAEDGLRWLYVQEYAAPSSIDIEAARRRRGEAFAALPDVTEVPPERIRVRTRRRQTEGRQYEKLSERGQFHVVEEGGLRFWVNFEDYLDTGLFLDHRITRARLREAAAGARFLNLFCYTATATVYAAAGGARATTSVDLSRTYLEWAARNLSLNGYGGSQHALVRADCLEWLAEAAQGRERFDLIFLDPPTFSSSKRMQGVLDLARDHPRLIEACMALLAPGGLLVFSTHAQRFRLDAALTERYDVRDISPATVPKDFERNPRIHRCYEIRRRDEARRDA